MVTALIVFIFIVNQIGQFFLTFERFPVFEDDFVCREDKEQGNDDFGTRENVVWQRGNGFEVVPGRDSEIGEIE